MNDRTKAKRRVLCELTAQARTLRDEIVSKSLEAKNEAQAMYWASRTLNSIIVEKFYKDATNTEFRTFNEWKQEGFSIIKDSHGFVVWGRPLNSQRIEKGEEPDDENERFYPISHIFSNAQVERRLQEVEG